MSKFQLQGPDVNAPFCDIEVKTRKHIPAWLIQPLRKTAQWSKSKISAVIWLNPDTDAVRDGVVVLSVPDFKILLESYQASLSAPSSPPSEAPSKSVPKARARYRWPSRRLTSRKFSN